jgi:DNA-binding Xre family transcriptional regulator
LEPVLIAQTSELIKTLNQALKAHAKTYADVSRELARSEASVKRLFSRKKFSLEQLDQICHMLDMEISDFATGSIHVPTVFAAELFDHRPFLPGDSQSKHEKDEN